MNIADVTGRSTPAKMTRASGSAKIAHRFNGPSQREVEEGRDMPGALHGVRVLDLSWGIAGPLGVLLLAERLGIDILRIAAARAREPVYPKNR